MDKKEAVKKESPKKDNIGSPKISGLSDKAMGFVKLVLGICLLPFVYSFTIGFLRELSLVGKQTQHYFWAGVISLVIVHLVIWEPAVFYARGQKIVEVLFVFFKPFVKFAPFLLPVYTIILFIICSLFSLTRQNNFTNILIFFIGVSIALHLVFSAKTVRSKQGDFLKANYIFGFALIYILNLILLVLGFGFTLRGFSTVNFFDNSLQIANNIFYAVFKQLFL